MHSEDTDDIFRFAYEEFEQEPSVDAWQKINARLDKKAIDSYRRRLVAWRGVAILLLLLLIGFIIFEQSSTLRGARKRDVLSNTDQLIRQEEKSNQSKNLSSLASQDRNTSREISRMANSRIVNSLRDFSQPFMSTILSQVPLSSITLKHSLPLSRSYSMSIAPFPALDVRSAPPAVTQKKAKLASPWSLTGFVTYERANYRLDNDLPPIQEKSLIQDREEHEASFSTGILANLQLRNRWSIQSGLIYSNTFIGIKPQMMYASNDDQGNIAFKYVTSSGYAYLKAGFRPPPSVGDSITTTSAQHNLQILSVPISVRYNISNRRLSLQPGVGLAINFLTHTKVVTEIEDASHRESVIINKLDGTRPLYLSLIADANVQYVLNNDWSLNLIPSFKYAMTPITKDHVVQTFPYSFGVGVGTTFKF